MFKLTTILTVFKETGLYPLNVSKVLDKLQAQERARGHEEPATEDVLEDVEDMKNFSGSAE